MTRIIRLTESDLTRIVRRVIKEQKSTSDEYVNDPDLKLDLLDERRLMTLAFQTVKMYNDVTHHYYGHFHRNDMIQIDGTKHRLLGVGELWEER